MPNVNGYVVARANATALPFVARADNEQPAWIVLSRHVTYSDAYEACARGRSPEAWLTAAGLEQLARTDRLRPVLVRMGGCRFTAPAQDARKIIDALEAAGDYCRDVSYPVST